eukprot:357234-Chlamydomonas_euryale.AAC.6
MQCKCGMQQQRHAFCSIVVVAVIHGILVLCATSDQPTPGRANQHLLGPGLEGWRGLRERCHQPSDTHCATLHKFEDVIEESCMSVPKDAYAACLTFDCMTTRGVSSCQ